MILSRLSENYKLDLVSGLWQACSNSVNHCIVTKSLQKHFKSKEGNKVLSLDQTCLIVCSYASETVRTHVTSIRAEPPQFHGIRKR